MYDFTNANPIYADAASRLTEETTAVAAGSTFAVGSNFGTNGKHALLRFVTTALLSAQTVVATKLNFVVSSTAATSGAFEVWASEFGATIDHNDYAKPANNKFVKLGEATGTGDVHTGRVRIGTLAPAATYTAGDILSISIPSRFIFRGDGVATKVSDFEIRPSVTGVPAAGHILTLHGPTATDANKPRLVGYQYTDDEIYSGAAAPHRYMAVGGDSYVGFAIEALEGIPQKAVYMLDYLTHSLDSYATRINSNARNAQRQRPRKSALGRAGAGGSLSIELTPEKWTPLLTGFFALQSGTSSEVINGVTYYTKTFKVGDTKAIKTFTIVTRKGPFREVFYGARPSTMSISASMDAAVTADIDFTCIDKIVYDEDSAGANDAFIQNSAAAYDTTDNSFFSFTGAKVTFDDKELGDSVQNFSVSFSQTVNERRGLNRRRRITGTYASIFTAQVNFSMYFDNDLQYRNYMGDAARDYPYEASCTLGFQKVIFELAADGCNTNRNTMQIEFPKIGYDTISAPADTDEAIMLSCSATANYSESSTASVIIRLKNSEPVSVYSAIANNEITILPPVRRT